MTGKTVPHMTKRDMEKYKGLIVRQYRMDSQKGVINNWVRDLTFEWDLDSKIKRGCAELYYYTDGLKIKTLKSPNNKPYSDLDLYPTYKRPNVYSFMSKIAPLSEIIETINRYLTAKFGNSLYAYEIWGIDSKTNRAVKIFSEKYMNPREQLKLLFDKYVALKSQKMKSPVKKTIRRK